VKSKVNSRAAWALGILAAATAMAGVRAAAQVSLSTVVDLAQRNSTAVKLAQADVNKASAVLSESKDVFIPSILFSTGLPVFPEVGFTGTPPSIWSGTLQSLVFSIPQKHYIDAARAGLQAAMAGLKDAREQAALDASTAYIEFDTVNRELEAARQQEGYADRLVEISQQRAEAGMDSLHDFLEAQLVAAQVKLKRERLEERAGSLARQLATLTALPVGSIVPDHASIPEIPAVRGDEPARELNGIESARLQARSKQQVAKGDEEINFLPQMSFGAQYIRNTTILNSVNDYFYNQATHKAGLPANNFSSGIQISVPLFDMLHRAKSRESAAEALRATVELEQAQRQNELQIGELTGSLRELDTLANIADLKRQIAQEQLKAVLTELQAGNGAGIAPGAPPQLTPKAEEQARVDEREKYEEALEADFDLARTRLGLLRALGHMQDWLNELRARTPATP
jgi:outer membrane protein TolC